MSSPRRPVAGRRARRARCANTSGCPRPRLPRRSAVRAQVDRPLAVVNAVNTTPVTWYVHVDHLNRPIKMTDARQGHASGMRSGSRGAARTRSPARRCSTRGSPANGSSSKRACITTGTGATIRPSAATRSPTRSGFVDGPSVYGYARGAPQSSWIRMEDYATHPHRTSPPGMVRPLPPTLSPAAATRTEDKHGGPASNRHLHRPEMIVGIITMFATRTASTWPRKMRACTLETG